MNSIEIVLAALALVCIASSIILRIVWRDDIRKYHEEKFYKSIFKK